MFLIIHLPVLHFLCPPPYFNFHLLFLSSIQLFFPTSSTASVLLLSPPLSFLLPLQSIIYLQLRRSFHHNKVIKYLSLWQSESNMTRRKIYWKPKHRAEPSAGSNSAGPGKLSNTRLRSIRSVSRSNWMLPQVEPETVETQTHEPRRLLAGVQSALHSTSAVFHSRGN